MIDERHQELASLHVLGLLSDPEAREFEQLLRSDAALREFVAELRATTDALAASVPARHPSPELKTRILSKLGPQTASAPILKMPVTEKSSRNFVLPWALAAGFAVALTVAVLEKRTSDRLLQTVQDRSRILESEVARLQERDRLSQLQIAMLGSLLESSPKAVAVSLWDDEKQKGVLVVENLAPLPADKDYQLWLIDAKHPDPVDAGVFRVDAKGNVRLDFKATKQVGRFDKIAVTVERKGGVTKPEGTMVLLGS
ncbi:MAG: anti-sigma factor [Opitutaceae bacterium]|nr:anti-sigma factor [Verrucomicrobiales bacterium]